MFSTAGHPASADGLRWYPMCGMQDASDISCFIDTQTYDIHSPFGHPEGIDPQLLLLGNPPLLDFDIDFGFDVTTSLSYPSESEILFGGSHSLGWPQEPYLGHYTIPEMQQSGSVGGGEAPQASQTARSCSPASDTSMLSDGASLSSLSSSDFSAGGQSPNPVSTPSSSAGPSGSQYGQLVVGLGSTIGPVRRGRGRPRKDAPPVYQPPPVCTYVDPLTGTPCGKLLNRHHDLPRHMVKHRQEEAALVNAGRLAREYATLLPLDWKHTDELKLPCRFCAATFSRADAVKRHEKREHKHRPRKG
ncbi:WD repeat-containing protein [Ceratobasidium sp. AG-Ba]|nr:WD repeat-containing protein [Ceratobasidium sp. AG-Ba]QRW15118.1 WD repeat-containing protein [Ceratobasidium sp. AG-Ba]